jgi:hypothetical protein
MKIKSKINNHLSFIIWFGALYNCRETFTNVMSALQIHLFMQNEPKSQKVKLDVNKVLTMDYVQMDTWSIRKNKAKTNPKQSQFEPNTKPIRTQFKAKQTQFNPQIPHNSPKSPFFKPKHSHLKKCKIFPKNPCTNQTNNT